MASPNDKDTIYIDIDDEITAIIEKVRASQSKIVALVLPKRATVLQSIVNMKLLKRSADNAGKSLVLITTEAGLLPLAGTVGLYTAKNLQSKPEIPSVGDDADTDTLDEPEAVEFDPSEAADKSVGDLAVVAGVPLVAKAAADAKDDSIETLELDDDAPNAGSTATATAGAATAAKTKKAKADKPKKDKKLAVPNFETFRKRLFIIIPVFLLVVVGLFLLLNALPKATIAITTDTSDINSSLSLTLDTTATTVNVDKNIVPAKLQKTDKSGQQQVPATGKKNLGDKATGSVNMTTCVTSPGQLGTVPAGNGVTSNGHTFVTKQDATFSYAGTCNGSSFKFQANGIGIIAQVGGADYNLNNATFTVAGYSGISASGSTSGGTDNIVVVVAQSDIDSATQKVTASNSDSVKSQLAQQLKAAGYFPAQATFQAGTPNVTSSSQVGDQASTVTVTQTTTYSMFGAKQSDLKALVDNDVKGKIDPKKQSILSEGLDTATFKVVSQNDTTAQINLITVATAGPDLNADALKSQVAGMKSGEIKSLIGNDPGVVSVDVKMSPFWVTSAPKKPNKITITFVKAKQ